jgi:FtsP/CotA-like multicopper oxidase with cupredoxin domain
MKIFPGRLLQFHLRQGRRYRIHMRNASDDVHPIHLHRHSFELTSLAGKPTAGILKDVVMLGGYQEAAVDFVADNPGMTLFHFQSLVGTNAQVATRHGPAEQHKARRLVLREKRIRSRLINLAIHQFPGTGKTAP